MAKKRAEEEANSRRIGEKRAKTPNVKRGRKGFRGVLSGSGKLDAAARAKDRDEKRRRAARAAKRGNVKGRADKKRWKRSKKEEVKM